MTVHVPKGDEPQDSPVLILFVLLCFLIVAVGVGWFVFFRSTPEPVPEPDTVSFCNGWTNGVAYAVYRVSGDPVMSETYALSPDAPPCRPELAVASDDPVTAWCRGLGEGYVAVSEGPLQMGSPPQGHDAFIRETLAACAEYGLHEEPLIVGSGPGGSGRNHG